jgi:hypothetical protein
VGARKCPRNSSHFDVHANRNLLPVSKGLLERSGGVDNRVFDYRYRAAGGPTGDRPTVEGLKMAKKKLKQGKKLAGTKTLVQKVRDVM